MGPGDGQLRERQRLFPYGIIYGSAGPGTVVADGRSAAPATSFGRPSSSRSGPIWKAETFTTSTTTTTRSTRLKTVPYRTSPCRCTIAPAIGRGVYGWATNTSGLRGNYVVNWGYCDYSQTVAKPDGVNPMQDRPVQRRTRALVRRPTITDGLSNTMFMGEVIQAINDADFDFRGDFFNDDIGAAQFMTLYTPNSGIDSMGRLRRARRRSRPEPRRRRICFLPKPASRRRERRLRRRFGSIHLEPNLDQRLASAEHDGLGRSHQRFRLLT